MSTPAQKANLARIRDNQRRSRARKREYLQELEQRLRTCELQGIEASAEVQMAARRVAEENRLLRELLHKQGVGDDFITHYLQTTLATQSSIDLTSGTATSTRPVIPVNYPGADSATGSSVQSLQQLLAPRRPMGLETNAPFPMASQVSRETSIASASTSASSIWESPQQTVAATFAHHGAVGIPTNTIPSAPQYSNSVYSGDSTPRLDSFTGQQTPQSHQQQQPHQQVHGAFSGQHLQGDVSGPQVNYGVPNPQFHQNQRHYGPPGGFC